MCDPIVEVLISSLLCGTVQCSATYDVLLRHSSVTLIIQSSLLVFQNVFETFGGSQDSNGRVGFEVETVIYIWVLQGTTLHHLLIAFEQCDIWF